MHGAFYLSARDVLRAKAGQGAAASQAVSQEEIF
jgi:hypothetical protein